MKLAFFIAPAFAALLLFPSCQLPEEEDDGSGMYSRYPWYTAAHIFQVVETSRSSVGLQWKNASYSSSANPTYNFVDRSESGGGFVTFAWLGGDSTSCADINLDTTKTYQYRVRSIFPDTVIISDTLRVTYSPAVALTSSMSIPSNCASIDLSPDGSQFAWRDFNLRIHLEDLQSGSEIRSFSMDGYALQFSSPNYLSTTASYYDTLSGMFKTHLLIYDIGTGRLAHDFQRNKNLNMYGIDLGEHYAVAAGDTPSVAVWSLSNGNEFEPNSNSMIVERISIRADGSLVAATASGWGVSLIPTSSGSSLRRLSGNSLYYLPVAFSVDGKLVAAASDQGTTCWNVSTGAWVLQIPNSSASSSTVASIILNNRFLITGNYDCTVKIWNIANGSLYQTLSGGSDTFTRLVLSPDGSKLYGLSLHKLNTWSLAIENCWHGPLSQ